MGRRGEYWGSLYIYTVLYKNTPLLEAVHFPVKELLGRPEKEFGYWGSEGTEDRLKELVRSNRL
jgi:hypothetical protein